MNLSVDVKKFKSQVEDLRKKLNESKINGILDEDYEDDLQTLLELEQGLLTELIPYYRLNTNNTKNTSMNIKPIKKLGAFDFDSFLITSFKINENLFITSSIDRKVQFFYIKTERETPSNNEIEGEWSSPIKEITEVISFIYKVNDKEILLFGVLGGCYHISSDYFHQMPDVNIQLTVKKIKMKCEFHGFGRCLDIGNGLLAVENGEEKINLFEIVKEKNEYSILFKDNIYCSIPNWTVLEKISENYFVVGTKSGELYFVKFINNQFTIIDKAHVLKDEIRDIKCIEEENGTVNSLIVAGNAGNLKILSLDKNDTDSNIEFNNLKGNLFEIKSSKGTAVVLSEDGIVYLFEENFGNWYLNEEATMSNVFYTNILMLDISKYLIMDIEGNLNVLDIDRINTAKDLWELPLYK